MENKRYISIVLDELYYTIDTKGLKTLTDFINEITEEYEEENYNEDYITELANDEYSDYLYEHSMTGSEVEDRLNTYEHENQILREGGHESQVKIETLSKIILRQSEQIKQLNWDKEI